MGERERDREGEKEQLHITEDSSLKSNISFSRDIAERLIEQRRGEGGRTGAHWSREEEGRGEKDCLKVKSPE